MKTLSHTQPLFCGRMLLAAAMLAGVLPGLIPTNAFATLPVVTSIRPSGVVRGEESVVQIKGARLGDTTQILCDLPGIEILDVKVVDGSTVDVKLKAAADLLPGLYPMRLVTKSGIANLRLIGVGALPIVAEQEPNNDFDQPQKIDLNCTIDGVVKREDIDHYQIALQAGQRINIEIEGIRLAYSLRNRDILDPYIAILDEGRFEVATSDDTALLQQDGFVSFEAPKDGLYTILVRESSFRGSDLGAYRLHVGTFPRPVAVIPPGGPPASILEADLVFADGEVQSAGIQLPSEAMERWGISTENEQGITPSPNWVRVNDLPVVMEQEPNNNNRKAPEVQVPAALCGVVSQADDFDCFTFDAKKGTKYRVEVFARTLRSPLDAVVNVFGPDHRGHSYGDDSRGRMDPFIEFDAKADGKHTIRIYDHLRGGSPIHTYRIEVTTPTPRVDVVPKVLRRDEALAVCVPIGGSTAMMVSAQRDRYNGPVNLTFEDLPEGVTATTFPMPAGRPEVPVFLTATSDAQHSAALYKIIPKGDEKNPLVGGEFSQHHNLVLGQNRRAMYGYKTKRAAMAVTDPVPFTIEVDQPKTAIVRGGSKSLIVRVKRNEGFDERVSIRTLYAPPGIGINNGRSVDKGKSEVSVPMTANGGAALGKWPIVFLAYYNTKSGQAVTATAPVMLTVENSLFKYEFPKSAGELGAEINLTIPMEVLREYQGDAEVQLVGIPAGVTSPAPVQKISPDSESVTFPLKIDPKAKVGKHKTLVCQSRVKVDGEVIVQTTGTGELRIDKPLPAKKDAPKQQPKPEAKKEPAKPKPLSRLEQLRQKK